MYSKHLKYRASSIRLPEYDYSNDGAYDITICTYCRECIFGDVIDGQMVLSDKGNIANDFWKEIPDHFPLVKLGRYQVMPNHVHGILIIGQLDFFSRDTACRVSTKKILAHTKESFGKPTRGTVPTIIRSYKAAVTRSLRIAESSIDRIFWQRGYYEHIIDNEEEFWGINNYIKSNPKNWKNDDYYK